MENENQGVTGTFQNWWAKPFNPGGTAFNWVLFVGLLIIAAFLWQTVLIALTREI